jgi:hypothetical protein
VRPALATTGGPIVLVSSPYAKRGELWNAYKNHHGANGDPAVLVAQGSSRDFNETLSQAVVDRAVASDPEKAAAEYLGRFRDDISSYLTHEAVMQCVDAGVTEVPAERGYRYVAFVDPSGGSADSMTLAIAHRAALQRILDCVVEVRPPFDPASVVAEFVAVMKRYRVEMVYGDRYGGKWVQAAFTKAGIGYWPVPISKSKIYADFAPLVNSGRVVLLDNDRLISQLTSLERRTGRGTGQDIIDHGPNSHDDVANSCAGAVLALGHSDSLQRPTYSGQRPIPPGHMHITAGEAFGDNRRDRFRVII